MYRNKSEEDTQKKSHQKKHGLICMGIDREKKIDVNAK